MMNVIFGTAGFAKEVDWLINDILMYNKINYKPDYFICEDNNENIGKEINDIIIISERDFFIRRFNDDINYIIAVGNPLVKKKIVNKIEKSITNPIFPNLIHPSVSFDIRNDKIIMGYGNIICSKTVLTTDIKIGSFVHINIDCTIGHDSYINNYSTISPGVHVSGNVYIAENVFIGTGAVILEKVKICTNAIIGAGAVVTKDVVEPGTYIGSPAKKIK